MGRRHRIKNGHRNGSKLLKICLDRGMLDNKGIIHILLFLYVDDKKWPEIWVCLK